ncbi:MAG: orotidine 5'-phosphate decarboxylase, partial [Candidatus Heimdallarchaeota archaeon]|nr:orotidine 5'-phosphate decarboxylase [Candidatus Heimdallarchaeota archaeon]
NKFIKEAQRIGIYAIVDLMGLDDPIAKMKQLDHVPDVFILHRGIDTEKTAKGGGAVKAWSMVQEIKEAFKENKPLVAVAGGIRPSNVHDALKAGADIIIVGRFITQSRDVEFAIRQFLPSIGGDIDLFRVYTE